MEGHHEGDSKYPRIDLFKGLEVGDGWAWVGGLDQNLFETHAKKLTILALAIVGQFIDVALTFACRSGEYCLMESVFTIYRI